MGNLFNIAQLLSRTAPSATGSDGSPPKGKKKGSSGGGDSYVGSGAGRFAMAPFALFAPMPLSFVFMALFGPGKKEQRELIGSAKQDLLDAARNLRQKNLDQAQALYQSAMDKLNRVKLKEKDEWVNKAQQGLRRIAEMRLASQLADPSAPPSNDARAHRAIPEPQQPYGPPGGAPPSPRQPLPVPPPGLGPPPDWDPNLSPPPRPVWPPGLGPPGLPHGATGPTMPDTSPPGSIPRPASAAGFAAPPPDLRPLQNEIGQAQRTLADLQGRIETLETERQDLLTRIGGLEGVDHPTSEQYQDHVRQIAHLDRQYGEMQKELNTVVFHIVELQMTGMAMARQFSDEQVSASEDISDLSTDLTELQQTAVSMNRRLITTRQSLTEVTDTVEELQIAAEVAFDHRNELERRLSSVERVLRSVLQGLRLMAANHQQIVSDVAGLRAEQTDLSWRTFNTERSAGSVVADVQAHEGDIRGHTSSITAMERQLGDAQRSLRVLSDDLAQIRRAVRQGDPAATGVDSDDVVTGNYRPPHPPPSQAAPPSPPPPPTQPGMGPPPVPPAAAGSPPEIEPHEGAAQDSDFDVATTGRFRPPQISPDQAAQDPDIDVATTGRYRRPPQATPHQAASQPQPATQSGGIPQPIPPYPPAVDAEPPPAPAGSPSPTAGDFKYEFDPLRTRVVFESSAASASSIGGNVLAWALNELRDAVVPAEAVAAGLEYDEGVRQRASMRLAQAFGFPGDENERLEAFDRLSQDGENATTTLDLSGVLGRAMVFSLNASADVKDNRLRVAAELGSEFVHLWVLSRHNMGQGSLIPESINEIQNYGEYLDSQVAAGRAGRLYWTAQYYRLVASQLSRFNDVDMREMRAVLYGRAMHIAQRLGKLSATADFDPNDPKARSALSRIARDAMRFFGNPDNLEFSGTFNRGVVGVGSGRSHGVAEPAATQPPATTPATPPPPPTQPPATTPATPPPPPTQPPAPPAAAEPPEQPAPAGAAAPSEPAPDDSATWLSANHPIMIRQSMGNRIADAMHALSSPETPTTTGSFHAFVSNVVEMYGGPSEGRAMGNTARYLGTSPETVRSYIGDDPITPSFADVIDHAYKLDESLNVSHGDYELLTPGTIGTGLFLFWLLDMIQGLLGAQSGEIDIDGLIEQLLLEMSIDPDEIAKAAAENPLALVDEIDFLHSVSGHLEDIGMVTRQLGYTDSEAPAWLPDKYKGVVKSVRQNLYERSMIGHNAILKDGSDDTHVEILARQLNEGKDPDKHVDVKRVRGFLESRMQHTQSCMDELQGVDRGAATGEDAEPVDDDVGDAEAPADAAPQTAPQDEEVAVDTGMFAQVLIGEQVSPDERMEDVGLSFNQHYPIARSLGVAEKDILYALGRPVTYISDHLFDESHDGTYAFSNLLAGVRNSLFNSASEDTDTDRLLAAYISNVEPDKVGSRWLKRFKALATTAGDAKIKPPTDKELVTIINRLSTFGGILLGDAAETAMQEFKAYSLMLLGIDRLGLGRSELRQRLMSGDPHVRQDFFAALNNRVEPLMEPLGIAPQQWLTAHSLLLQSAQMFRPVTV